jgi:hypothetical protein
MGVHARVDPVKKRAVPQARRGAFFAASRLRVCFQPTTGAPVAADQGISPIFDLFPYFGRCAEIRQILPILAAFCLFDAFLLPF